MHCPAQMAPGLHAINIPKPDRCEEDDEPTAGGLPPTASSRTWGEILFPGLDRLGASSGALLCVMLALNALVLPYFGLDHDARLYAVQALERVQPGLYADDLYLRFGSQDRYTVFSFIVTPLVAVLGVKAAFFLVYLASKALFFWGALRLLRVIVRDREAVVLGALFLAVVPVPFGGNEIFNLNESFLTPRIASSGLALLALEGLVVGRPALSFGLLVASFLLHPIMALGGFLVWVIFLLSRHLSWKWLTALAGCAIVAGVVAIVWEPLGQRLFGHVDEKWRDAIFRTCFFIRPSVWAVSDWLRIAWGVAVIVAASAGFARASSRLLLASLAAAVLGFAGTAVAVQCHYLRLIQASPYRAMWLLELLAVPLGIAWAYDLRRRGTDAWRTAGLVLLPIAMTDWAMPSLFLMVGFASALPILGIINRGTAAAPRRADWLVPTIRGSFVAGFVVLCLYNVFILAVFCFVTPDPKLDLDVHPLLIANNVLRLMYKLPILVLVCHALAALTRSAAGWRFQVAVLTFFLGYSTLLLGLAESDWYGRTFSREFARKDFVGGYLDQRPAGRAATVYRPGDLRCIWFDLGSRSYFNVVQLSGCAFNRGTAIEGLRRSQLVRRFEAAVIRRHPPPEAWWREALDRFYDLAPDEPPPSRADLIDLCKDPNLDIVVIEQKFEGLYAATDGKLYIYDCEVVRRLARTTASGSR